MYYRNRRKGTRRKRKGTRRKRKKQKKSKKIGVKRHIAGASCRLNDQQNMNENNIKDYLRCIIKDLNGEKIIKADETETKIIFSEDLNDINQILLNWMSNSIKMPNPNRMPIPDDKIKYLIKECFCEVIKDSDLDVMYTDEYINTMYDSMYDKSVNDLKIFYCFNIKDNIDPNGTMEDINFCGKNVENTYYEVLVNQTPGGELPIVLLGFIIYRLKTNKSIYIEVTGTNKQMKNNYKFEENDRKMKSSIFKKLFYFLLIKIIIQNTIKDEQNKIEYITLYSVPNPNTLKVYSHLGFKTFGTPFFTEYRMLKKLKFGNKEYFVNYNDGSLFVNYDDDSLFDPRKKYKIGMFNPLEEDINNQFTFYKITNADDEKFKDSEGKNDEAEEFKRIFEGSYPTVDPTVDPNIKLQYEFIEDKFDIEGIKMDNIEREKDRNFLTTFEIICPEKYKLYTELSNKVLIPQSNKFPILETPGDQNIFSEKEPVKVLMETDNSKIWKNARIIKPLDLENDNDLEEEIAKLPSKFRNLGNYYVVTLDDDISNKKKKYIVSLYNIEKKTGNVNLPDDINLPIFGRKGFFGEYKDLIFMWYKICGENSSLIHDLNSKGLIGDFVSNPSCLDLIKPSLKRMGILNL